MPITCGERPLILVTANSPGEISYWLAPFLEALAEVSAPPRVFAFAPPCQFRSGWEEAMLRSLPLVERVFGPRETVAFCLGREAFSAPSRGLVLFMGGDLLYAKLLKRRSGYPLWVYDGYPRSPRGVDQYFARFPSDFHAVAFPRKVFLGDLLRSFVDRHPEALDLPSGAPRFCFLPGSRSFAYRYLLPFFKECGEMLRAYFPQGVFLLAFPRFLDAGAIPSFEDLSRVFLVVFGEASRCIEASDVVVTVPGSNNLEILYRRKRALVLVPLWKEALSEVPISGVGEILGRIPFCGRILKRKIVEAGIRSREFVSLPNQVLGRMVFPELRGEIRVDQVVAEVLRLLEAPEPHVPEGVFPKGAAEKLVRYVLGELYGEG